MSRLIFDPLYVGTMAFNNCDCKKCESCKVSIKLKTSVLLQPFDFETIIPPYLFLDIFPHFKMGPASTADVLLGYHSSIDFYCYSFNPDVKMYGAEDLNHTGKARQQIADELWNKRTRAHEMWKEAYASFELHMKPIYEHAPETSMLTQFQCMEKLILMGRLIQRVVNGDETRRDLLTVLEQDVDKYVSIALIPWTVKRCGGDDLSEERNRIWSEKRKEFDHVFSQKQQNEKKDDEQVTPEGDRGGGRGGGGGS